MSLLETVYVDCPYCGEKIDLTIDCSTGVDAYVEDCQVCCRPMNVIVGFDLSGKPLVEVRHENE
ncbi:hypothetical protein BOW53_07325 [Solemya pervernicosa gill symbiont]|uniref:CPXCG motif-containing cysteine-rich protein n=2 Tax=Gammaproteobacteria incertae sedis TaxID=118884 RepID=A0A1T2L5Z0_9GAMM|nr:CPXCG motif-containing cysteine-rich protein [Candidatus Reidiella endopervernicosa]OOZ40517.1 hypothetical protein BOW53_07325 [Solemya pervernicosa gill symbiont]QKQ27503.1 CPXCG motif-containing cysteine-rich protein [Candidatus Reidiella endopervernicosa]